MDDHLDKLCGKGNWVAYCINLEKAVDRKKNFESFANHIGLTFNFFTAVDKSTLKEPFDFNIKIRNKICAGPVACRLSHKNLMQHYLKNHKEDYLFIFEDDAGFSKSDTIGFGKNSKSQTKENLYKFLLDVTNSDIPWNSIFFGLYFPKMEPITDNIYRVLKTDLIHAALLKKESVIKLFGLHIDPRLSTKTADTLTAILQQNSFSIAPPQTLIDQVDNVSFMDYPPL